MAKARKKARSAAQKANDKRLGEMSKKGGKRSKRKKGGKKRSGQIPLPILRKRLIKLSNVIRSRTS